MRGHAGPGPDAVTVWWCEFTGDERARARERLIRAAAPSMGVPAAAWRIDHDQSGRPRLRGHDGLHISFSHAPGVAVLALTARAPVGVDVEALRPLPALALARRWLTESETAWLGALPADRRVAGFLRLWTQKEAIGKARGRGLRAGGLRQPVIWPELRLGGDADRTLFAPVSADCELVIAAPPVPAPWMLAVACGRAALGLPVEVRMLAG